MNGESNDYGTKKEKGKERKRKNSLDAKGGGKISCISTNIATCYLGIICSCLQRVRILFKVDIADIWKRGPGIPKTIKFNQTITRQLRPLFQQVHLVLCCQK